MICLENSDIYTSIRNHWYIRFYGYFFLNYENKTKGILLKIGFILLFTLNFSSKYLEKYEKFQKVIFIMYEL